MGSSIKRLCVVPNAAKNLVQRELPRLKSFLRGHHVTIVPPSNMASADAVLTLGGDGTILSIAAHAAVAGLPVLGVNVGRLGFMTTVNLMEFFSLAPDWLRGKWPIEHRQMISVQIPRLKTEALALNDAVIRIGAVSRVTRIFAAVENDELGFFTGDGIIVSTSTGSTAYSLSAHGPVVHPDVDALILTPICAHSFSLRPVVFPADRQLRLKLHDPRNDNEVQLCLDGQRVYKLRMGDTVMVTGASRKLMLIRHPRSTYFGVLREKLKWGEP